MLRADQTVFAVWKHPSGGRGTHHPRGKAGNARTERLFRDRCRKQCRICEAVRSLYVGEKAMRAAFWADAQTFAAIGSRQNRRAAARKIFAPHSPKFRRVRADGRPPLNVLPEVQSCGRERSLLRYGALIRTDIMWRGADENIPRKGQKGTPAQPHGGVFAK